jgi:hypothetical protein
MDGYLDVVHIQISTAITLFGGRFIFHIDEILRR